MHLMDSTCVRRRWDILGGDSLRCVVLDCQKCCKVGYRGPNKLVTQIRFKELLEGRCCGKSPAFSMRESQADIVIKTRPFMDRESSDMSTSSFLHSC